MFETILGMTRIQFIPARLVEGAIQSGQNHSAARQIGNHAQQLCRCRNRTCGTGGNHQTGGRFVLQLQGERAKRLIAMHGRTDRTIGFEQARPFGVQQLEEVVDLRPMFGQRAWNHLCQAIEGCVLRFEFVHNFGQTRGERASLRQSHRLPVLGLVPATYHHHQQQVATERRNRGRAFQIIIMGFE